MSYCDPFRIQIRSWYAGVPVDRELVCVSESGVPYFETEVCLVSVLQRAMQSEHLMRLNRLVYRQCINPPTLLERYDAPPGA